MKSLEIKKLDSEIDKEVYKLYERGLKSLRAKLGKCYA